MKNQNENETDKKQHFWLFNGLINICLVAIILVCVIGCGLSGDKQAIETFKSYNGVIYAGDPDSKSVAIMINVYWGTEYLGAMLDILSENNAKATFFVGKVWAEQNPDMLRKIYAEGHEIGNHGSNHKEHGKLSYEISLKEIEDCHLAVKEILGIDMNLFAPPGGSYNKSTVTSATALGYQTLLWTKDTIDWRDQNPTLIFERATNNIMGGELILMHPTKATASTLDKILKHIKNCQLELETVSQVIG